MKNSTILFKYTSRSRPELFERGLKSIVDNLNQPEKSIVLVSIDEDDVKAEQYKDIVNNYFGKIHIRLFIGKKSNKIGAINRDLNDVKTDWQILINMSDDMVFIQKGFDDVIRKGFAEHFPEGDGFLHFNDGYQKANVSTMTIMDRKYYDRFGYIYHPLYKSVWCDVEQTDVAFALGRYKYMGDEVCIFEHLHPALGKAENDDQYRASENLDVWGEDLKVCIDRKTKGYDLILAIEFHKYPASAMQQWKIELNNARQNVGMQPIMFN